MLSLGAAPLFPRPIRKRAWHKARERGDLWLIVPYCMFGQVGSAPGDKCTFRGNKFAQVHFDRNCPNDMAYIMWPWNAGTVKLEFK